MSVRRYAQGWSNSVLVLLTKPNKGGESRFGFVVSKRVGKAVVRNKIKRRLREIGRVAKIKNGWDIVVIARKPATSTDFAETRECLLTLLRKAGVTQDR